ncbi:class I glutamine amidotransferase [Limosilactobacillus coleohominis 101-4-CHN]|uniref:Class I glutamine amidotransferase n=1 Tax=Limosilactobacillus coleohominis 101-4-CHN TaxID=575594 RepID=C7XX69_9LACO|nr:type 1 glutamine amidotransferase [Limosilactobacillus coleohominis]EEU29889.1 class I glutamine amidotransferase [Limosilactobacillus coleohominis 101-4-CHN]
MRINVLQHTPNEGPGSIQEWSHARGHEMYVYHPAQFHKLPTADQTDMLVILGGPMSPNDDDEWIHQERTLVRQLHAQQTPIFGACFGAQQISKAFGGQVGAAPHKEGGWAPVYRQSTVIEGIPEQLAALHWHQEMFSIPDGAELLFSSDLVTNQGFVLDNMVGLQFHFEPLADNVREIVVNDGEYALDHNDLHQTPAEIIDHGVPAENQQVMFTILDYLSHQ